MAESKKPEEGKSAGASSVPMLVLVSTLATLEQRLAWAQAWLAHLSAVVAFLQTHHNLFLDQLPALPAELVLQKGYPLPYQLPLVGKKEAPGALLDMIRANNAALHWIIQRGHSPLGNLETMTKALIAYRKILLNSNAYRASELRQVMAGAIVPLFEQYVSHVLKPLLREANLRRQVQLVLEAWRAANVPTTPAPQRLLTANDRAHAHDWLKRHDDATLAGFKAVKQCREARGSLIALCVQIKVPFFKTATDITEMDEGILLPPILDERVPLPEKKAQEYLDGVEALKQVAQQFASERERRISAAKTQGAEEALKSLTLDRVLVIVRFLDAAKTVGAALEAGVTTQEIWALAVREGSGVVLDLVDRVTRKAPLSHERDRDLLRTLRREADQLRRAMVASAPAAEDDEDDLLGLLTGDDNTPVQAPTEKRPAPTVSPRSLGESALREAITNLNVGYAGGYPKLPKEGEGFIKATQPDPDKNASAWVLQVTEAFTLGDQIIPTGSYNFCLRAPKAKEPPKAKVVAETTSKNDGKPLSKEDRAAAKRAARGGTFAEQLKALNLATADNGTNKGTELPN